MSSQRQIAILGACALLAATGAGAADAGDTTVPAAKTLFVARVEALRTASSKDSSAFAGFLDESFREDGRIARKAWDGLAAEFPPEQLADFFAGANVLVGPVSRNPISPDSNTAAWSGVIGLYNPWWDAFLVLRLNDILRIDRLAFYGGEAFRGEASGRTSATSTVVPVEEPLSRTLLRAQTKVVARFRELYPGEAAADEVRIPSRGVSRDLAAVKSRAALRERLMRGFLASSDGGITGVSAVAGKAQDVFRHGDANRLRRFFADPARHAFCDAFAELPADLREGFGLYGYVPAKEGTLFVFLNPAMPRIYATVSFPAGREEDADAGNVVFEWFDLAQAGEITQALERASLR